MQQLSKTELDLVFARAGKGDTPLEILEKLEKKRERRGQVGPDLTSVRRAPRVDTHRGSPAVSRFTADFGANLAITITA